MKLLVTDLEATCSNNDSIPREESEIIEIGSVIMELQGKEWIEIAEFQTFIKPVIHAKLTDYCTNLTKITQKMVDEAPLFEDAYQSFKEFATTNQVTHFASWGGYDARQFIRSLKTYNEMFMFNKNECLNLKELYAQNKPLKKKRGIGLGRALRNEGLEFVGTPHRGIDDAKNIARLLNICIK